MRGMLEGGRDQAVENRNLGGLNPARESWRRPQTPEFHCLEKEDSALCPFFKFPFCFVTNEYSFSTDMKQQFC